ncbi:hypothetical protein J5X84_26595 [Streptosporangiaceae bacterium NEAU-GS5]|nr:hypothetical protein [Streptosporangiaceae bacterium NEAU-GS5]
MRVIALVRPIGRAVDWVPLLVAGAAAIALAALAAPGERVGSGLALLLLRATAVLLGTAAGFALVDPLDEETEAAPAPRWVRQWLRAALALLAVAGAGAVVALVLSWRVAGVVPVPLAGMALCALTGPAGAALVVRALPGRVGGLAGGVALAVLCVVDPWDVAHLWWPVPLAILAYTLR